MTTFYRWVVVIIAQHWICRMPQRWTRKHGVVSVHACNHSTQKMEAGGNIRYCLRKQNRAGRWFSKELKGLSFRCPALGTVKSGCCPYRICSRQQIPGTHNSCGHLHEALAILSQPKFQQGREDPWVPTPQRSSWQLAAAEGESHFPSCGKVERAPSSHMSRWAALIGLGVTNYKIFKRRGIGKETGWGTLGGILEL